jgi:hypothetical protein
MTIRALRSSTVTLCLLGLGRKRASRDSVTGSVWVPFCSQAQAGLTPLHHMT